MSKSTWKPIVLGAYCALLALIALHHEPWFDEAQAWLIARDASLRDLCFSYLRVEGTPGLWHMLLMPLAKPGLPYWSMHVLSAACAVLGAALVLWLSPFPPWIRAIIPFTYFLLYQYAVVARSYVLLMPLLAGIAWLVPQARFKPWFFIALLSLLANVSIHGTLAAVGILSAYLIETLRNPELPKPRLSTRFLVACGAFSVVLALVVIEVWPPPAAAFVKGLAARNHLERDPIRIKDQIAQAFSFALWAALVPLGLSLVWMVRNRVALYFLLPAGLVLAFSTIVYSAAWHAGILFLLWLFAMWIATNRGASSLPPYIRIAWIMVLGMHVYWSVRAGFRDIVSPYSGSKAAAERILPEVMAGKRIAGLGFMSLAVEPYFRKNIFVNYHEGHNPAFWLRTPHIELDVSVSSVISQHPDLIVASLWKVDPAGHDRLIQSLKDSGFGVIEEFPGEIVWKSGILIGDNYLVAHKGADR